MLQRRLTGMCLTCDLRKVDVVVESNVCVPLEEKGHTESAAHEPKQDDPHHGGGGALAPSVSTRAKCARHSKRSF